MLTAEAVLCLIRCCHCRLVRAVTSAWGRERRLVPALRPVPSAEEPRAPGDEHTHGLVSVKRLREGRQARATGWGAAPGQPERSGGKQERRAAQTFSIRHTPPPAPRRTGEIPYLMTCFYYTGSLSCQPSSSFVPVLFCFPETESQHPLQPGSAALSCLLIPCPCQSPASLIATLGSG